MLFILIWELNCWFRNSKNKLYLLWFWMKRCTSRKICNTDMQTLWSQSVQSYIYLLSQRVEYGWLEVVSTLHIETIWVLCWSKLHLHTNLITLSQKTPQTIWLRHSIVFHSVLPSISTSWCYFKWGSHLIWQNISHGSLSPLAKIYGERERERESLIVYNYLKLEQTQ